MDSASRSMLADLGATTRNAIVSSISERERHDVRQRSSTKHPKKVDPTTAYELNKWNAFHLTEASTGESIEGGPVATASKVRGIGQDAAQSTPHSVPDLQIAAAPYNHVTFPNTPTRVKELRPASSKPASHVLTPAATQVGSRQVEVFNVVARSFASRPGPDVEAYYTKFPDRKLYLDRARADIAKELLELVQDPQSTQSQDYRAHHTDRQWMWDATVMAKKDKEEGTNMIGAHCKDHPERKPFCILAQECRQQEAVIAGVENRHTMITPSPRNPVPKPETERAPGTDSLQVVVQPATVPRSPSVSSRSLPSTSKTSNSADIDKASMQAIGIPTSLIDLSDTSATSTSIRNGSPSASMRDLAVMIEPVRESSTPSASTTTSASMLGSCVTVLYDVVGKLVGTFQTKIQAPVQATITLASKVDTIGVEEFTRIMKNFAQAMDTASFQVMSGVRDDGSGLYDVDDLPDDLGKSE